MIKDNQSKKYIKALEDNLPFFQALSSSSRLRIIALLQNKEMSIKDLSDALNLSSAVITKHINILESVDIIESYSKPGIHGLKKLCKIKTSELQIILNNNYESNTLPITEIDIPIGSFSNFHVAPPCGLASKDKIIGVLDDPRYFAAPERSECSII